MALDVAIDLGSSTTSIVRRGGTGVLTEPTVVTRDGASGSVLAVGTPAARMVGRTPAGLETVFPVRAGVVVDEEAARSLVRTLLRRAGIGRMRRIQAVVCVPTGLTPVERRAVVDVVIAAGVAEVRLLGHTMAAALGCGLPVDQPVGSLVVDLGAATTEAAVFSLGGVVAMEWSRVGGLDLDQAIRAAVERDHDLVIDRHSAERTKLAIGRAFPPRSRSDAGGPIDDGGEPTPPMPAVVTVRGRSVTSGVAGQVQVSAAEATDALRDRVQAMVDVVAGCVGWAPPEIANDLIGNGAHLVGGTALLPGLAPLVADACRLPVRVADRADQAVVRGAARCLGRLDGLDEIFLDSRGVGLA